MRLLPLDLCFTFMVKQERNPHNYFLLMCTLFMCLIVYSVCLLLLYLRVLFSCVIFVCQIVKQERNPHNERWGAGVETQKNVLGEIGGWGRVPFNEPYAPSLSTIYDGA